MFSLPTHYIAPFSPREIGAAIKYAKDTTEQNISALLHLERVTAPVIVPTDSGLNDDLSGTERKVTFTAGQDGRGLEVVQSLAKWKRMALHQYGFGIEEGLYTDMNALRRDETEDAIHSIFVDQWDWERVISPASRTLDYLMATVCDIVKALVATKTAINQKYPHLCHTFSRDVSFISAKALYDMYPTLSAEEREYAFCKHHPISFIWGIGEPLPNGQPHTPRAPDYDDWTLNGDLLLWSPLHSAPIEISSMGIRVNGERMLYQLAQSQHIHRLKYAYHRAVLENDLPQTIGGGIGQSRLCMLLLEVAHIGEVQVSAWSESERKKCASAGITLL